MASDRQQEFTQAVQPFRRAVDDLVDPMPGLLAGLLAVDDLLAELDIDLPLVDLAPFGALRDQPFEQQRAERAQPDTRGGRATSLAQERTPFGHSVAAPLTSREGHARSAPQDAPTRAPRQDPGAATTQMPVFSLRPPAAPRQGEPTGQAGGRRTAERQPGAGAPGTGRSSRAVLDAAEGASGGAAVSPTRRAARPAHEAGEEAAADEQSTTATAPTSQLDQLASDVLSQMSRGVAHAPGVAPAAGSARAGSRRAPPRTGSPSVERASSSVPRPPFGAPISPRDTAHGTEDGSTALTRIGTLADRIMAARSAPGGGASLPGEPNSEAPEAAALSQQDLLAGEARAPGQEQAGGVQPGSKLPGSKLPLYDALGGGSIEAGRHVDPDLLALLINDILVEQARRHGVDLS